jgi:hypothetical protein
MLVCVFLCAFCTRDRGCSAHPAFPAPSCFSRVKIEARLGRIAPRGLKSCLESTCLNTSLRVGYRPWGRPRWMKQTPLSSPGLTGRPRVFQRRLCSTEKPRLTGSPGQAGRRQSCCGGRLAKPLLPRSEATQQSSFLFSFFVEAMDSFAEPVIGRAFARPVGSQ